MKCTLLRPSIACTPWLLLLGGALPLAVAYISQYGFDLFPCKMCLWQRYPYMAVVALSVLAIGCRRNIAALRALLAAGCLLFLTDAAIAGYHVAVEEKWVQGSGGCTSAPAQGDSLEDLRAAIVASPLVSCDEPAVRVLGISMAGWNLLASLGLFVYGLRMLCLNGRCHESRKNTSR